MKLEAINQEKLTDTVKKQSEEINALKATIAEMTKANEATERYKHTASVRTSFILPNNWSDLEKLWLAFKVMDADGGLYRNDTYDARDDVYYNIWRLILQAVLIAPTRTHEDLLIKLEAMDYFSKWHLQGRDNTLNFSEIAGFELEATAINKQLTALIEQRLLPEQKEFEEWRKQRNATFEKNCANLTDTQRQEIKDNVNGNGAISLDELHNGII